MALSVPSLVQWGEEEVGQWLDSIACGSMKPLFKRNNIIGEDLVEISDEDLAEIGVRDADHRKWILSKVRELVQIQQSSGNSQAQVLTPSKSSAQKKAKASAKHDSSNGVSSARKGKKKKGHTPKKNSSQVQNLRNDELEQPFPGIPLYNSSRTPLKKKVVANGQEDEDATRPLIRNDGEGRNEDDEQNFDKDQDEGGVVTIVKSKNSQGTGSGRRKLVSQLKKLRRKSWKLEGEENPQAVQSPKVSQTNTSMNDEDQEDSSGRSKNVKGSNVNKEKKVKTKTKNVNRTDSKKGKQERGKEGHPKEGSPEVIYSKFSESDEHSSVSSSLSTNGESQLVSQPEPGSADMNETGSGAKGGTKKLVSPQNSDKIVGKKQKGDDEVSVSEWEPYEAPKQLANYLQSTAEATGSLLSTFRRSDLQMGNLVAVTPSGTVHIAIWRGTRVALKQMRMVELNQDKVLTDFTNEVQILTRLRHPNIVSLMACAIEPPELFLMMELMEGGSLHDMLHVRKAKLSKLQKVNIAFRIAQGMNFIHLSKIIHRDLKPQNILLDESGSNPKICDFGLSKTREHTVTHQGLNGTAPYMAPELLDCDEGGRYAGKSDERVDVYSFAIVLWELFARRKPWEGKALPQLVYPVLSGRRPGPIPQKCPPAIKKLIEMCWLGDYTQRPYFSQIINILEEEYKRQKLILRRREKKKKERLAKTELQLRKELEEQKAKTEELMQQLEQMRKEMQSSGSVLRKSSGQNKLVSPRGKDTGKQEARKEA